MLRKRKFRELKTANEEKAFLEKSTQKSTNMSQNGLLIFSHSGKYKPEQTSKEPKKKKGLTWNGTKSKV